MTRLFPTRLSRIAFFKILLVLAAALLLLAWLALTPAGLLGKADAIAYAVCHRIAERSFFLGDRQHPLCARCTGMYLGALLGLIFMNTGGRRMGGMPSKRMIIPFVLFLAAFGIDGVNSYLHLLPGAPGVYEPNNWLRLLTGTGMGLGIAAALTPVFHQSVWREYSGEPALKTFRQLAMLVVLALVVDAVVLTENPLLTFPLAVLGAATVPLVLTTVYTVVWTMVFKQENRFDSLRGMWSLILIGFCTAMIQISAFDAARYWLTGTWEGLKF